MNRCGTALLLSQGKARRRNQGPSFVVIPFFVYCLAFVGLIVIGLHSISILCIFTHETITIDNSDRFGNSGNHGSCLAFPFTAFVSSTVRQSHCSVARRPPVSSFPRSHITTSLSKNTMNL